MDKSKIAVGILVVATIIALIAFFHPHVSQPIKSGGIQATTDFSTTNFTTLSVQNGEANGGLYTTASRVAMIGATTTVCAIQSPNATSTLTEASALFTVSSTTASIVSLAKATTAFATTTGLGTANLAASAQGTVIASTSPTGATLDGSQVFAPLTWFVVGVAGGVGTFSPTGICTAEWQVMQ